MHNAKTVNPRISAGRGGGAYSRVALNQGGGGALT